jgi:4'-phosphopantetheinyl transferase
MDVYWLEQDETDVRQADDWLTPREIVFLDGQRFAKRRADWRLGRWTAKRALAACLKSSDSPHALVNLEVWPAASGAPEVFFENRPVDATISLSHSHRRAMCVVAPGAIALGCDLELIEVRSDAFIADYFTAEEQAQVVRHPAAARPRLIALLWSAKESALKALHEGLRLDTRSVVVGPVDVSLDAHGWSPLHVRCVGGQVLHGWWQITNDMVRTVVADPPPPSPISLGNGDFYATPRSFLRPHALSSAKRAGALPVDR